MLYRAARPALWHNPLCESGTGNATQHLTPTHRFSETKTEVDTRNTQLLKETEVANTAAEKGGGGSGRNVVQDDILELYIANP